MWSICALCILCLYGSGADQEVERPSRSLSEALSWNTKLPPYASKVPAWLHPSAAFTCEQPGYFADDQNCKQFYFCAALIPGRFIRKIYRCDEDRLYSVKHSGCVKPEENERAECNSNIVKPLQRTSQFPSNVQGLLEGAATSEDSSTEEDSTKTTEETYESNFDTLTSESSESAYAHSSLSKEMSTQMNPQFGNRFDSEQYKEEYSESNTENDSVEDTDQILSSSTSMQDREARDTIDDDPSAASGTIDPDTDVSTARDSVEIDSLVSSMESTASGTIDLDTDVSTVRDSVETTDSLVSSMESLSYDEDSATEETFGQYDVTEFPTTRSSIDNSSQTNDEICIEEGFFPDTKNCTLFYRCVQLGFSFVKHIFSCPVGTIWDSKLQTCNFPTNLERTNACRSYVVPTFTTVQLPAVAPDNGSTSTVGLTGDRVSIVCPTGFRQHPKYCNTFYQCTVNDNRLDINFVPFACPRGTVFDEKEIQCRRNDTLVTQTSNEQNDCTVYEVEEKPDTIRVLKLRGLAKLCPDEGQFPYGEICPSKYFKCIRDEEGSLAGYLLDCPADHLYSSNLHKCVPKSMLPFCIRPYASSRSYSRLPEQ